MKKFFAVFYITACMVICLIPFAGMTFWATDSTTENKVLASFPSLFEDGSLNVSFLEDLGTYFEDHFAFREALVNADAEIMARVFQESNEDSVILGTDGWLYYTATLDDYLGQDLMSARAIYNAAHNLKLTQEYVEASGAQFLLAVAPNKNSLYGDNMPYYDSVIVSDESNWENLVAAMDGLDVSYADLFTLFGEQDEVLYLKRDSHWNNRGALLAYNYLTECLGLAAENFETTSVLRTKTEIGDLGQMLFPLTAEAEWNYYYEFDSSYSYVTDTTSVEDTWIITENSEQDGSLLLFRDSFGNTLLPFFAGAFGDAYFSRGEPYAIGRYLATYSPEVVIIERVERNIDDFASNPAMFQAIAVGEGLKKTAQSATEATAESDADPSITSASDISTPSESDSTVLPASDSDSSSSSGTAVANSDMSVSVLDNDSDTSTVITDSASVSAAAAYDTDVSASASDTDASASASDTDAAVILNAASDAKLTTANETTCSFYAASDILYYVISGTLDESFCQTETEIYIRLTCGENTVLFPAFYISNDASDYGYQLYLEKEYLNELAAEGDSMTLEVLTETNGAWLIMAETEIAL